MRGKAPIVWEVGSKAIADKLLYDGGCNMVPELDAVAEDEQFAAMLSRDLADRLQGRRLVVGEREAEWQREYEAWRRSGAEAASTTLMRATRLALARLSYARPRLGAGKRRPNHPNIPVL